EGKESAPAAHPAWSQMPAPRARTDLTSSEALHSRISRASTLSRAASHPREDAAQRGEVSDLLEETGGHDHDQAADHAGMEHDHMEGDHMGHGDVEKAAGGLARAGERRVGEEGTV